MLSISLRNSWPLWGILVKILGRGVKCQRVWTVRFWREPRMETGTATCDYHVFISCNLLASMEKIGGGGFIYLLTYPKIFMESFIFCQELGLKDENTCSVPSPHPESRQRVGVCCCAHFGGTGTSLRCVASLCGCRDHRTPCSKLSLWETSLQCPPLVVWKQGRNHLFSREREKQCNFVRFWEMYHLMCWPMQEGGVGTGKQEGCWPSRTSPGLWSFPSLFQGV